MNDCPFCDFKPSFSQELAYHLMKHHAGPGKPLGRWLEPSIKCWCDQGPFSAYCGPFEALSQFAVHLQRCGGATAHWLEHSLGLANPFGDVPYNREDM